MSAEPVEQPEPEDRGAIPIKKSAATKRTRTRKSGDTAASEQAAKSADEATAPMDPEQLPEEREEWFRAPGFQRMKMAFDGPDKAMMDRVQGAIARRVWDAFPEALAIMNDIYEVVRLKEADPVTGEEKRDPYGFTIWVKDPLTGAFVEDWTLLTIRDRESFLFRIATQIFEWEQRSADLWTEAMMSKGMFTERFSIEFDAPIHGTVDDRTARGNIQAAEDRYFAIMNAAVSRKAEAIVRTMNNLMLRLRDSMST